MSETQIQDESRSVREAQIVEWLREQRWSDFARSLVEFYDHRGYLTNKQVTAAERMIEQQRKRAERKQPAKAEDFTQSIPEGRYAIESDGGEVAFYRVQHGKGEWQGYAFLLRQAGGDLYPKKGQDARNVLRLIAQDPQAASLRYGQEIGSCGVCGRSLTDERSRAAGIGPVCAQKRGWAS